MLRVLKATLLIGYTAEQIRLSSTSCDCGKNPAFNWTILCGWPNQKLYYQLISWECSSEDSGLVIWRKSMRSLFSKSCVCLTEDWGKMALSSPDRNHRRNYLPKATKQEELWAWDPHQCSCSAEPGCRSPRIMKNSQAVREICQLLYFSLEKSSFPLITCPVPYRHNSSWWSWYMCYLCFHIPFKEITRAWTLYERSPVWKKKKRKKKFQKGCCKQHQFLVAQHTHQLNPLKCHKNRAFPASRRTACTSNFTLCSFLMAPEPQPLRSAADTHGASHLMYCV